MVENPRRKRSRNIARLTPLSSRKTDESNEGNVSTEPDCVPNIMSSMIRRRYFKQVWDEMTEKLKANGIEQRKVIKTMRLSSSISNENKKALKRKRLLHLKCNRVIYKRRNNLCNSSSRDAAVLNTKKKRFRRRKKKKFKKSETSTNNP